VRAKAPDFDAFPRTDEPDRDVTQCLRVQKRQSSKPSLAQTKIASNALAPPGRGTHGPDDRRTRFGHRSGRTQRLCVQKRRGSTLSLAQTNRTATSPNVCACKSARVRRFCSR